MDRLAPPRQELEMRKTQHSQDVRLDKRRQLRRLRITVLADDVSELAAPAQEGLGRDSLHLPVVQGWSHSAEKKLPHLHVVDLQLDLLEEERKHFIRQEHPPRVSGPQQDLILLLGYSVERVAKFAPHVFHLVQVHQGLVELLRQHQLPLPAVPALLLHGRDDLVQLLEQGQRVVVHHRVHELCDVDALLQLLEERLRLGFHPILLHLDHSSDPDVHGPEPAVVDLVDHPPATSRDALEPIVQLLVRADLLGEFLLHIHEQRLDLERAGNESDAGLVCHVVLLVCRPRDSHAVKSLLYQRLDQESHFRHLDTVEPLEHLPLMLVSPIHTYLPPQRLHQLCALEMAARPSEQPLVDGRVAPSVLYVGIC
mmetsp:Transcript_26024/g.58868  ORF Transcript_26024/g.58868 Transcript_26024/m.58868 type:complete len:368 (+) Transcript_26024:4748-5851(+)